MKDIIYVESNQFATVKDYSLLLRNFITKKETLIPLDSISVILFTHQKSYFSNLLVSTCLAHNILVIFCNHKHSPVATVASEYGYIQRVKRLHSQLTFQKRNKERIWVKIISQKIYNQFICLKNLQKTDITEVNSYLKTIKYSNVDAKEAFAAKNYFKLLFGSSFIRGRYSDIINRSLNYAYAVVRAYIRQQLVMRGLEVSMGIHHHSTENPFNLSDDIIEPFRPIVDQYVYEYILEPGYQEFSPELNRVLVQVLYEKCILDNKSFMVGDAISKMVDSYLDCLEHNQIKHLLCPQIVEGGS